MRKIALVTGGSRGIGAATCQLLAASAKCRSVVSEKQEKLPKVFYGYCLIMPDS